jgi:hypothetical protein
MCVCVVYLCVCVGVCVCVCMCVCTKAGLHGRLRLRPRTCHTVVVTRDPGGPGADRRVLIIRPYV